jgi:5-methylthioadenosine/S-adenosylhomocysteine deaminase
VSLLVKNALIEGTLRDIYVSDGYIREVSPSICQKADQVLNAGGKAAIPSFVNGHTHSAMTLLRGYADDMHLQEWLEKKIWPLEEKLSEDDIYRGAKLACLEMIKSGTTLFNDMYWHWHGTARAVKEMGLRGIIGAVLIDMGDREKAQAQIKLNEELFEESRAYGERINFSLGPHAIYTVSEESLRWCHEFAACHDAIIHLHLSETEREVTDCLALHKLRPVEYLHKIGILSNRLILAHCIWLNDHEIDLLKAYDVKVVHNPVSNMKLASGSALPYEKLHQAGITILLGTDGCSSNNNLDMLESMKFACLLQKYQTGDSSVLSDTEVMNMATIQGGRAFNMKMGRIEPGFLADLLLVDLDRPEMTPCYNLVSNLVYSANGSCIDTVICNGTILMKGNKVDGEEEIIAKARETSRRLISL